MSESASDFRLPQSRWIKFLTSLDTHFVFMFGKRDAGKSAILASLLHVGNTPATNSGVIFTSNSSHDGIAGRMGGNEEFKSVIERLQEQSQLTWGSLSHCFSWSQKTQQSSGFLPTRTEAGRPPLLLDGTLTPSGNSKRSTSRPINITLLEIAGETLSNGIQNGDMPTNIEVYFQTSGIPMIFLVLVPWHDIEEDDELVSKWIKNIQNLNKDLSHAHFILLLTKWDENPRSSSQNPESTVREKMPKTYQRLLLTNNEFVISPFTIGSVVNVEMDAIDISGNFVRAPFVQRLDVNNPIKLWNAIYRSFTGMDLIEKKSAGIFNKLLWKR